MRRRQFIFAAVAELAAGPAGAQPGNGVALVLGGGGCRGYGHIGVLLRNLLSSLLLLAAACDGVWTGERSPADPGDAEQVARGAKVYAQHCAACHGAKLEGQPEWRRPLPNGRMPAPPHDESGHTWHHTDEQLFGITKHGLAPYAPKGYESDMPAYAGVLADAEIWAVLAYIKSHWKAPELLAARAEMLRNQKR